MQNKIRHTLAFWALICGFTAGAQEGGCYWQQHVDYTMDVSMNVENYQYTGTQSLKYTNNSPDTLQKVFYHLYPNAFQPGSEMDVRSGTIPDPDPRVMDRISKLSPSEIGYLKVKDLKQDGETVTMEVMGTILKVGLSKPILPGQTVIFDLEFNGQVPIQIRRSGRNNADGVALSMTQWYPKLAEYDFEGWHADPYIGREFHGVWGDFDVKITIDKSYVLGGTGYLQNPDEIGFGYETPGTKVKKQKGKTKTWHFKAPMVHDFTWAADPEYIHDILNTPSGVTLHFFYKGDSTVVANWKKVQQPSADLLNFFNKNIGPYPWKQYSIIQGGDGGMEYAMSTLITGGSNYGGLYSTVAHEMAHAWFQQSLASNESEHPWLDEGFASFIATLAKNSLAEKPNENPFEQNYQAYINLVHSEKEAPMTTHADRYALNRTYSIQSYVKGSIFLSQLGYVIGQDKLMQTLRRYYQDFKFKHPTPNDIIRTAEKVSDMELEWYLNDWTRTTNTIDYGIKEVISEGDGTKVTMERIGLMPMPVDVLVVYNDNTQETFYAPLRMMYGGKDNPYENLMRTELPDWAWAYPTYEFKINRPQSDIKAIVIDPSQLMADVDWENNIWQATP